MNINPMVSVILPAYNAEEFIGDAIESILNQTYTDYEFIILDDDSKDGTWNIIQKYEQQDKRIITVKNDENLYISRNRNKGLALAKGKYIVWQDADDLSLPTRISKLVDFMEAHPEVGICGSYIQSFNGSKNLDIRTYAKSDTNLRKNIFKFSPVAQPAAIVRKEAFDKVGTFNEKFPPAEDLDLSFRIGNFYEFANIPEVLLKYREHPQSATRKKLGKQVDATLEIRKMYRKNPNYHFGTSDYLAYAVAYIAQYIPSSLAVRIFKLSRKVFNRL